MTQPNSDSQQFIEKLNRQNADSQTESVVAASSATNALPWIAKIISKYDYNWYNVAAVETGSPGTIPMVMSNTVLALNTAEPFLSQGALAIGTYVMVSRIGDKYAFNTQV